jgi:CheY-like chemotaxis protein
MPARQEQLWDRTIPPELEFRNKRERIVADTPVHPTESNPVIDATAAVPFRFRILVVDDEPAVREAVREILESRGYEVLTAADGLDGLHALRGSLPDLIISDLNMPRMSGIEFLSIVRERFPHIATIAMSGGYSTGEVPLGVVADAFLQKGSDIFKELSHQVGKVLAASPLRPETKKSEIAPLLVPRDSTGYLVITCPKCLRPNKLQAMSLNGGLHQTTCQSCGTPVRFEISHEIEPLGERKNA